MNDDWRLRIDLHEHASARGLTEKLDAEELEHSLDASFHDRVVVSRDGAEVFCYTGTREQAESAEALVRALAVHHGWEVDFELKRWHPTAEDWEDPDVPLPDTEAKRASEHAAMIERERDETREHGHPEFEVRVQCRSHQAAVGLADSLRREGLPTVRRWRFLLVGAADEDSASALAARLRSEAPPGSTVTVEGTLRTVLEASPFAVLGGLGG
jgi:hypothetical protein